MLADIMIFLCWPMLFFGWHCARVLRRHAAVAPAHMALNVPNI